MYDPFVGEAIFFLPFHIFCFPSLSHSAVCSVDQTLVLSLSILFFFTFCLQMPEHTVIIFNADGV